MKKVLILAQNSQGNFINDKTVGEQEEEILLFSDLNKIYNQSSSFLYDEIKVIGRIPNEEEISILFKLLISNGKMLIEGIPSREAGQSLTVDLKICGFIDIMAAKDPSTGDRFVVCQRPTWEIGSKILLNIVNNSTTISNNDENSKKWKMAAIDLADDDLIDEDALLDANPVVVDDANEAQGCGDDTSGAKKRACKNCSCGLAEIEAQEALSGEMSIEEKSSQTKSSCGSCYKGDAFRCGSCPFLGKPAFEPGNEKVVLSLGADDI
eukprot:gene5602-7734_t